MDAIFKIRGDEFDEALFKKIKALIRKNDNADVLIHVTDEPDTYRRTLEKSIGELDQPERLITFAMEELQTYGTGNKNKKGK